MVGTRRLSDLAESMMSRLDLPEGPLVVGLSGGADSAALSWLVVRAGREIRGAHVNHGLAGSPLMEKVARSVADEIGIDLEVRATTVLDGPSPEGQARKARYDSFAEATGSEESLLTGHTRDDHVETVLFNLIRGTGPKGLAGIPYHRAPSIYRPMLAISRAETRELATLAGLGFVDDPMNEDLSLTRNMIRSKVYPVLSELNPRLPESVARMSRAIADDNRHLDEEAAKVTIGVRSDGVSVAVGDLLAVPKPVADRVLKQALTLAAGSGSVTADRVAQLWSVVDGAVESVQIKDGVSARRSGSMLLVQTPGSGEMSGVTPLGPGSHRHGRLRFEVTRDEGVCRVIPLSRWSAVFPSGTDLVAQPDGSVEADGERAWIPGAKRLPVAWYQPGAVGYLSVFAMEESGWTSSP